MERTIVVMKTKGRETSLMINGVELARCCEGYTIRQDGGGYTKIELIFPAENTDLDIDVDGAYLISET